MRRIYPQPEAEAVWRRVGGHRWEQVKAVNNRRRNFNEARLTKAIKAIEEKIDSYLHELDKADDAETDPPEPTASATELGAKIAELQRRKAKYQALKKDLQESGEKQVS